MWFAVAHQPAPRKPTRHRFITTSTDKL